MAEHSTIEWTEATWQIVTGCSVVTAGCTNCYAMRLAGTRLHQHPSRAGLTQDTKAGPVWTGEVRFNREWLTQPLQWKRPRKIFVAAHGDLFHEGVPDDVLDQVFAVMAAAAQHTFQVLTKRSDRARAYLSAPETLGRIIAALQALSERLGPGKSSRDPMGGAGWNAFAAAKNLQLGNEQSSWPGWPLRGVWLGVSVEDQRRADERIPDLLATPAAVRWISAEPLLGPVDLMTISRPAPRGSMSALRCEEGQRAWLDWVVVGGESGPGARPIHPDWARSLRDQCAAAATPFLFKQWGAWVPEARGSDWMILNREGDLDVPDDRWADENAGEVVVTRVGKKAAGRLLDGVQHDGFPEARA
jgi:protein gp37